MRLACPYQLSPTQNLLGNGMMASAKNQTAGGYLPSDNPTSLVAWFRFGIGITESGGFVSAWADQSGNGNDLLQATGTNQPAYSAGILTFDGVDNFMKCVAFTLNQPTQVSMLAQQVSWASQDIAIDGDTDITGVIQQLVSSPTVRLYAGAGAAGNSDWAVGVFDAVTALFAGASSSLLVGTNAATTGNAGTSNMGGFTLASAASGSFFFNMEVKEIIIRNVNDATIRQDDHDYLLTL